VTYLNDPVLVDIVEHFVHDGRDNFLRTTGNGECDGGGVEIARESLSGENGLSLEEIPFTFVLDQGNEISDRIQPIGTTKKKKVMEVNAYGSQVASNISNWAKFSLRVTPLEVTESRSLAFLCR